jgi:outer membrane protein assembly factor BamE (lipoprotein component of BamABCDE complex)
VLKNYNVKGMTMNLSRNLFRVLPLMLIAVVMLLTGCKNRQQLAVENTSMGSTFTPAKFAEVKIGDDLKEVRLKLGQPFQALAGNDGRKHLIFSWPKDKKKEYVGYDVFFGPNDKVTEKMSLVLYEDASSL